MTIVSNSVFLFPLLIILVLSITIFFSDNFASANIIFLEFGEGGSGDGQFSLPNGIDIDNSGNIYVADSGNHRIQKFDSNGNFLGWMGKCTGGGGGGDNCNDVTERSFGFTCSDATCSGLGPGSLAGQFNDPNGLFIDDSNNIFVVDEDNDRIQKFDLSGNSLLTFGTTGNGPGDFFRPDELVVDSTGNIYVADRGNLRTQKLTSTGTFIDEIAARAFNLAIDDQNNLWEITGTFLLKSTSFGPFVEIVNVSDDPNVPGAISNPPFGLGIDSSNNLYIADDTFDRILKFDSSGNFISRWGDVSSPRAIRSDSDGNVLVTAFSKVVKFAPDDNHLFKFGSFGTNDGEFNSPIGVAVDSAGNIYVAEDINARIQKFDSAGMHLLTFGSADLVDPTDIVVNSAGVIYVADDFTTVKKFDSSGNLLLDLNTVLAGPDQFVNPSSLGIDASDNLYVTDISDTTIKKISPSDTFLLKFGSFGSADGQFQAVSDVTADSSGNIYVTDSSLDRIQKFDSSGNFDLKFGTFGTDPGEFVSPTAIAVDVLDNIYVVDKSLDRVQKFDSSGNFVFMFSGLGTVNGAINNAAGMAVDSSGKIYIAEDGFEDVIRVFSQPALCAPPPSIDWTVSSTCTMTGDATADGNVIVPSGVVLTIPNLVTLDINFATKKLIVESGGGVLIESGGKIT